MTIKITDNQKLAEIRLERQISMMSLVILVNSAMTVQDKKKRGNGLIPF
jgi:hypothetical protein